MLPLLNAQGVVKVYALVRIVFLFAELTDQYVILFAAAMEPEAALPSTLNAVQDGITVCCEMTTSSACYVCRCLGHGSCLHRRLGLER